MASGKETRYLNPAGPNREEIRVPIATVRGRRDGPRDVFRQRRGAQTRIDRYIRKEAIVGVPIPPVEAAAPLSP